jgi:hypothetical protein
MRRRYMHPAGYRDGQGYKMTAVVARVCRGWTREGRRRPRRNAEMARQAQTIDSSTLSLDNPTARDTPQPLTRFV